jgi:NAD(P)-dependent dehydrogenase (short-subunit alcohol dehydrogenase family)
MPVTQRPEEYADVSSVDLSGSTVLVTGSTSGIGKETALALGRLGAEVLVHGRDRERGEAVRDEIRSTDADGAALVLADLSTMDAVREFAAEVRDLTDRIDVLVNNAGVYFRKAKLTEDGIEYTIAVNHLAPFLLTHHLLPAMPSGGRVITTSSGAHQQGTIDFDSFESVEGYSGWSAYGQSKLANILFTRELDRRTDGFQVNAFHPGFVPGSAFMRHVPAPVRIPLRAVRRVPGIGTSVEEGAATAVMLAADPDLDESGQYFTKDSPKRPSSEARDDNLARRLWERSEALTDLDESLRLAEPQ